jgi:hypothetical protein
MHKLPKQNVFTENKLKSECINYLERMKKLLKQNAFTENKFQTECRNYLNKMRLPTVSSRANAEITLTKCVYQE